MARATLSSPRPGPRLPRVLATPSALDAIAELTRTFGPVLFFQSGGCSDGSLPICLRDGEVLLGDRDLFLGRVGDCPFYIDHRQFEPWKTSQLTFDVAGVDPEGFSLGAGPGRHFVTRSRICPAETLTPPEVSRVRSN